MARQGKGCSFLGCGRCRALGVSYILKTLSLIFLIPCFLIAGRYCILYDYNFLCTESTSYVIPFWVLFFYLVTTSWSFLRQLITVCDFNEFIQLIDQSTVNKKIEADKRRCFVLFSLRTDPFHRKCQEVPKSSALGLEKCVKISEVLYNSGSLIVFLTLCGSTRRTGLSKVQLLRLCITSQSQLESSFAA